MKLCFGFFIPGLLGLMMLTGCTGPSRGSRQSLEDWENAQEYDPVTQRWFHTQTPPSARDVMFGDSAAALED